MVFYEMGQNFVPIGVLGAFDPINVGSTGVLRVNGMNNSNVAAVGRTHRYLAVLGCPPWSRELPELQRT